MTEIAECETVLARFFESAGKGDLATALTLIDDDCLWIYNASTDFVPFAGTYRGPRGVAAFFQSAVEHVRIEAMAIDRIEPFGDRLLVRGRETSTALASGKTFEAMWLHDVRVANGRITHYEEYVDTAVIADALRALSTRTGG